MAYTPLAGILTKEKYIYLVAVLTRFVFLCTHSKQTPGFWNDLIKKLQVEKSRISYSKQYAQFCQK
jgi:hypothetical protein